MWCHAEYALLWRTETAGPVGSKPVFSPGERYVLTGSFDGAMWCLNGTSGAAVWSFQTGGAVHSDPTLTPDGAHVFFGSYDNHVYKLATGF